MPRADPAAQAFLVISPGGVGQQPVPILDRLFVGRKCSGIDQDHRVLIEDSTASRVHFEIRLDPARNQAYIVDTSTNGTFVNGQRLRRATPQPIRPGDRINVGESAFEFRSEQYSGTADDDPSSTQAQISSSMLLMVVGDITNYSSISQVVNSELIASSLKVLYAQLTSVLMTHRGTLSFYAGDALYAIWEVARISDANELAVDFALAANRLVDEVAPGLPLRGPDRGPVQMGWGVVKGRAAMITLPHSEVSVVGDATNLAFRLSGLAGREGRAPVIVAQSAREAVTDLYRWGTPESLPTKGRTGQETVYPVWGRNTVRR